MVTRLGCLFFNSLQKCLIILRDFHHVFQQTININDFLFNEIVLKPDEYPSWIPQEQTGGLQSLNLLHLVLQFDGNQLNLCQPCYFWVQLCTIPHVLDMHKAFTGFKAFMQLALISRPTSSSAWVILDEIVFSQSQSSIFSDIATSFLSTGKCFLV